ncbi:MAG TPA: hypothetical protein VK249_25165 [Anaerolineales bacterium]|nr:hypothetical protein [Anaerolineales bacterium]
MRAKQVSLTLLIVMAFSLLPLGGAEAKEVVKVTIAGPGLNGQVELTDTESLKVIRELGFADESYEPASQETNSYFEIRMAIGDGTQIVATGIYHYYPASAEHPGYLYYADGINAWSSRDGQYFLLPKDTEEALDGLLVNLGAALPDKTARSTAAFPRLLMWSIVGICFCISVTGAIMLKRRAVRATVEK